MSEPRIIAVGEELPPLIPREPAAGNRHAATGKASKAKDKTGERFAVLNGFIDFTLAELSRAEMAVWLILYRDTRDGTARTSIADVARRAGCSARHVKRALRQLELTGLVKVIHRGGLGRGPSHGPRA